MGRNVEEINTNPGTRTLLTMCGPMLHTAADSAWYVLEGTAQLSLHESKQGSSYAAIMLSAVISLVISHF